MIRVLHIISCLGSGGVENQLYNIYSCINRDEIHFDFVVHGFESGLIEKKIKALGSEVVHVTPKKVSLLKNCIEINDVIKKGKYDIIHVHQNFSSFTTLFLGLLNHVRVRIVHARGYIRDVHLKTKIKQFLPALFNKLFATQFLAISEEAGRWLYGRNWHDDGEKNILLRNSIDTNRFSYNQNTRRRIRDELKLNSFTMLMVGRFSTDKNQRFAVEVFEKVLEHIPDAVLMFVGEGEGEKENEIKKLVKDKKLDKSIKFLGVSNSVEEFMCAVDLLIFPSLNEGFGNVAIEAQCCGLPVIASDRIPMLTAATDLIKFLPLEDGTHRWEEVIISQSALKRYDRSEDVAKEFSIDTLASNYKNLINRLMKNKQS